MMARTGPVMVNQAMPHAVAVMARAIPPRGRDPVTLTTANETIRPTPAVADVAIRASGDEVVTRGNVLDRSGVEPGAFPMTAG